MNKHRILSILVIFVLLLGQLMTSLVFAEAPIKTDRFKIIWLDEHYDRLYGFSNGVGVVGKKIEGDEKKRSNMQLIDTSGSKIGSPFKAYHIIQNDTGINFRIIKENFGNDIDFVTRSGKKLGLSDIDNKNYDEDYYHGMVSLYSETLNAGLVLDKEGQVVIKLPEKIIGRVFKERANRLIVMDLSKHSNFSCGLIDLNGKTIIPLNYSNLVPSDNIISTVDYTQSPWRYYHFDYDGNLLFNGLSEKGYHFISPFKGGTAIVEKDGKKGVIDESGQLLIKANYKSVRQLNLGYSVIDLEQYDYLVDKNGNTTKVENGENIYLYAVGKEAIKIFPKDSNGGAGYIDFDGKYITNMKYAYDGSGLFNSDIARAYAHKKYYFIDLKGIELTMPLDSATDFNHGYALFNYNGKTGILVDTNYNKTMTMEYSDATKNMKKLGDISQAVSYQAIAITDSKQENNAGLANAPAETKPSNGKSVVEETSGHEIILLDKNYKDLTAAYLDYYVVYNKDKGYRIIDNKGNAVLDQDIKILDDKLIDSRGEQIYLVKKNENSVSQYGLLSNDGKWLLAPKYSNIQYNTNSNFVVVNDQSSATEPYSLYNIKTQSFLNGMVFEDVGNYYDDLGHTYLQVSTKGKTGIIDENCQWVVPLNENKPSYINEGRYYIRERGIWLYKDIMGNTLAEITKPYYSIEPDYAVDTHYGIARLTTEGYGIINEKGEEILAPRYVRANALSKHLLAADIGGSVKAKTENYIIRVGAQNALFNEKAKQLTPHKFEGIYKFKTNPNYFKAKVVYSENDKDKEKYLLINKMGETIADYAQDYIVHYQTILKNVIGEKEAYYYRIDSSNKTLDDFLIQPKIYLRERYINVDIVKNDKVVGSNLLDTFTNKYLYDIKDHFVDITDDFVLVRRRLSDANDDKPTFTHTLYDAQFNVVVPETKDKIQIHNNIVRMIKDDSYYTFTVEDKTPIKSRFFLNSAYINGYSYHQNMGDVTFVDKKDNIVRYGRYKVMTDFNGKTAMVKKDGRLALITLPKTSATDVPSLWAKDEVTKATALGLIPQMLQGGYQSAITRGDFCKLIITMLTKIEGRNASEIATSLNVDLSKSPFKDAQSDYIVLANKLGIVNGKSADTFDPLGKITRQEAAKILANTAKYLKVYRDYTQSTFKDKTIANWAKAEVNFVNQYGLMKGVATDTFSPLGTFTREQTYITLYRFYNKVKP